MVYKPHTLVAFGGRLLAAGAGGTDEIWENTMRFVQADNLDHTINDPIAYLNGIMNPLATWFHSNSSLMSTTATLAYVKVNNIGADGKYQDPGNVNRHDYLPEIVGNTNPVYPDIISCCWSWRTAKTRGPGSKGRIYPPNFTIGNAPSMSLTEDQRNQHLGAATALVHLLEIGDGDTAAGQLVIASKVNATNTPVTTIAIGSVLDVQRRRKNAEVEVYTTGPSQT